MIEHSNNYFSFIVIIVFVAELTVNDFNSPGDGSRDRRTWETLKEQNIFLWESILFFLKQK